jgi:tetratricopeptide (TPR) repeat protein
VRGQLTKASALQSELGEASPAGGERLGSEILDAKEHLRAMQVLLDGIGTVMAGDGVGGSRILRELTAASQRNLSFRWLALQWSAWAAVRSGSSPVARSHVKEALTLARQLDIDARAVSQWTAAEALALGGDSNRALAWLNEARARFERLGDRWGVGQTWLAEARIMASNQREQEGAEAARKAREVYPEWDEPPIFLARRALMRDDLVEAEQIVRSVSAPAADRVRALIEAIRAGTVTQADGSEFLREHDAPPSAQAVRALERIASAWPRFVQAKEALAWMLLKLGKYTEADTIFRGLMAQELTPGVRASVMLGLGCIAQAEQSGSKPGTKLHAAVNASDVTASLPDPAVQPPPLPRLSSSGLNGSSGPNAVFSGQLSVFALPDLLEFLRSARRTGLLVCSSAAGMGALRFRDGWITGAASPSTPNLGQILLGAEKISALALESVAARQRTDHTDQVIGELLVREGLVGAADVQEALRQQIELTIRELVRWKDGEFAFNREGQSEPASTEIAVSLDAQAVLLNVFKEMDEASRSPPSDVEL